MLLVILDRLGMEHQSPHSGIVLVLLVLVSLLGTGAGTPVAAQTTDTAYFRHSIQFNIAGLAFERYGIAYEFRMAPRHALFLQGGGSFPGISEEVEQGYGLHYRYFFEPGREARFLWFATPAHRSTFGAVNVRYMDLSKGIHDGAENAFRSFFIGVGAGQTWTWDKGFTLSYWLGYGPPIGADFTWKDTVPPDGDAWEDAYTWSSGLDFGLSLGYSFGGR
ncbi:MAG: hypothetical protein KDB87_17265 [Flavobacteriales bacterium]|nr:hypothetical protein [Flavobacteriales bacterium]